MCKNKTLQLRSICITYTKVENYNSAQKSCVFFNTTQAHYLFYWLNHQKLQAATHTFYYEGFCGLCSGLLWVSCDIIKCFFGILWKITWFGKGFKNMLGKSLLRARVLVSSACRGFKNGRFSCQIVHIICVIPVEVTCYW